MTADEIKKSLAAKDGRYARKFGLSPPTALTPRPPRTALPCRFVGDDAGPRGWHLCDHEDEPLGAVVCACKGCGVRCPGYAPGSPRPAGGG